MDALTEKKVLVSGASIAGLSTAYWMNKLGYKVTVVEIANEPRTAGAAIDIRGTTVAVAKRMGIFEPLISNRLTVDLIEFKEADDRTAGSIVLKNEGEESSNDDIEIERDKFITILVEVLKNDVDFMFNNSITALSETENDIIATFKDGTKRAFDLVFGCDGSHSGVRKIWFGHETEYSYFLNAYFQSPSSINC
ncbi:FAD-dependent monooxygenase [Spirosoma linguale]|uniref:FAD-dependent monooxygenase n=1 Tax=Spirosoma linguale TaxID=108 RepID=UPI0001A3CC41